MRRTGVVVVGILIGVLFVVLVGSVWFMVVKARDRRIPEETAVAVQPYPNAADGRRGAVNPELPPKVKSCKVEEMRTESASKSGFLIFSPGMVLQSIPPPPFLDYFLLWLFTISWSLPAGESELYTLEQLMRASAELLGRGSIGTTYKAVLDNRFVVTVKRLDSGKTACTSKEAFESHLDVVGRLRHPNLVPMRAFFQAKGERLVIFDYQPNGSLHNLIHGMNTPHSESCLYRSYDRWL